MEIEQIKRDSVVVLVPDSDLNTQTSPALEQALLALFAASERRFVVDFSKVGYLSSAGLRVLLMLTKRLAGTGGGLALCGLGEEVRKIFALCGFEREFNIVASRNEAVSQLAVDSQWSELSGRILQALAKAGGARAPRRRAARDEAVPPGLAERVRRALA
jgi:stage II sporulation protein AA (anti-sigma F factor antagonist)